MTATAVEIKEAVVMVLEPVPTPAATGLKQKRNSAFKERVEAIQREPKGSMLVTELAFQLTDIVKAIERDLREGRY